MDLFVDKLARQQMQDMKEVSRIYNSIRVKYVKMKDKFDTTDAI